MAARVSITENELLDELRAKIAVEVTRPDGYCTSMEMSEAVGKAPSTIRLLLRKLHIAGEIEVTMIQQVAIDGRKMRVPAYRLVKRAA